MTQCVFRDTEIGLQEAQVVLFCLAKRLKSHEEFRSMLMRTDPELRRGVYNALLPSLSFEVGPFEAYE